MSHPVAASARAKGLRLLAFLAIAASCKAAGKPQAYTPIGVEAEAVRKAFNDDAGKVRLVVLVAPT